MGNMLELARRALFMDPLPQTAEVIPLFLKPREPFQLPPSLKEDGYTVKPAPGRPGFFNMEIAMDRLTTEIADEPREPEPAKSVVAIHTENIKENLASLETSMASLVDSLTSGTEQFNEFRARMEREIEHNQLMQDAYKLALARIDDADLIPKEKRSQESDGS